eukprot:1035998-Rhodomonas_salina.2
MEWITCHHRSASVYGDTSAMYADSADVYGVLGAAVWLFVGRCSGRPSTLNPYPKPYRVSKGIFYNSDYTITNDISLIHQVPKRTDKNPFSGQCVPGLQMAFEISSQRVLLMCLHACDLLSATDVATGSWTTSVMLHGLGGQMAGTGTKIRYCPRRLLCGARY